MSMRIAESNDAEEILSIYEPYIRNTSLTFEVEVPSVSEFAKRISIYTREWPWVVFIVNEKIVGYAYASKYRERKGYQWSVECSVYVHDEHMNKGVAAKLYHALFDLLRMQGYRNVYAVINLPNDRSVSFHEKMGFTWFATYEKVGYKLGKWKDVGWWKLILDKYDDDPAAPIPFSDMPQSEIEKILNK